MTTTEPGATKSGLPKTNLPDELHAHHLLLLASGGRLMRIVQVLVELGLADMIGDGTMTADEIADKTGMHAPSLYRVLRAAAAVGILVEEPLKTFGLTPLGNGLRSNHPDGIFALVKYSIMDLTMRPYAEIMHSVRTGEPAFESAFGVSFYQYLEDNPEISRFFERFMRHWSRQTMQEDVWQQLRPQRFNRIADLGGGDGFFLSNVLREAPDTTGYLLDLPGAVAAAPPILEEHGVADRVTVIPGDFLTDDIPQGCDAYLFKGVMHNLSNDKLDLVLGKVRDALDGNPEGRLLIFDHVLEPPNQWDFGKFLDVDMLVLFGGHERTLEEFREAFDRCGFELLAEPTDHWALLECRVR
ncbi:methyltransferase [Gandjariella thermophila]|uniref:Methyltransferase n=1 Tax=Gandjariella thermophila TaxID=1931992 RepID=A0A4D4J933_9PSEU|nr:methyltransferase [Gandjariella thermophila]GDY31752.1 methyltransferase [Gandjariella thermophila]